MAKQIKAENLLHVGDRIQCKNKQDLQHTALMLSTDGYGIAVFGHRDIVDNVLTITEVPECDSEHMEEVARHI